MDFLAFAAHCGPTVHALTTQAIVRAESGFDPLVIRNNTLRKTFRSATRAEAVALAIRFHAQGHQLALGLMQVTTPWLHRFQIGPETLLDGCANIRFGTTILADNYIRLLPSAGTPEEALAQALSAYWSGKPSNGGVYVNHVYHLAGSAVRVPVTPGVTDGLLGRVQNRSTPLAEGRAPKVSGAAKQSNNAAVPNSDAARRSPLFFNSAEIKTTTTP